MQYDPEKGPGRPYSSRRLVEALTVGAERFGWKERRRPGERREASQLGDDGERLVLERHRLFEANFDLEAPPHPKHEGGYVAGVYGGSRRSSKKGATPADDRYAARHERKGSYVPRSKAVQQALLGIDWMTIRGMQESIPPAYAEFIGNQMIEAVR